MTARTLLDWRETLLDRLLEIPGLGCVKDIEEQLKEHGGTFQNETSGQLIDRSIEK